MPRDLSVLNLGWKSKPSGCRAKLLLKLTKYWEAFRKAMNRITGKTCAFVCMSNCTYIHIFLTSTTISSYPKTSEIHRIGLNPLNLNPKKINHLCAKPVKNSFCFILKKLTSKENKKAPKSNQPKKTPWKTRSRKPKETDLNAILHYFYYSLQQKASNEFSGF